MNWQDRITSDPKVLMGKPVVKGTRLAVGFLLELLSQGWTEQRILENYPQLKLEDIKAVLAYSAARIKDEEILPLGNGKPV